MGNVDGIPVASQVKSMVQASHGDMDAAVETQRRFSERCIGVAQVRSVVEIASGDAEQAVVTQQRFFENTHRLLESSDVADAVPGVSQLKSLALAVAGDTDGAIETQKNFTRRCPVVSQVRSACEAFVLEKPEEAAATQRDFVQFASGALDKVPAVGHAKGLVHHAMGDHGRGDEALSSASESFDRGAELVGTAVRDIFEQSRQEGGSSGSGHVRSAPSRSHRVSAGLTQDELEQHTSRLSITEAMCESHKACPICLQAFSPGESGRMLPCFHAFHAECSERWLGVHGDCPVCRCEVRQAQQPLS